MAGSLDKLMLTVGLLDRITGPMKGIQKTIQKVTNNSRKAFMNTAAGVTALIAASSTFAATINPANDLNMALGEVRSLEVADSTLAALNKSGLKYSIEFGDQASNYVRSAYDIQSAIDGLVDNDLPRFTTAAGTLAKATKANVTDITSYFGTMYGIFKNQANEIGKGTWVEMLAGQTATAVQMFKTTGPEMSAAFESIGADATTMGIKISEQMAVLGSLQSTMSGSEAGTKYGAFLQGLSGAQGKLDLSFTDESGKLLPIVEILEKIKIKTKGLNALQMQDVLSGAFGSDEAVGFIKLMSNDIEKLHGDIDKLGKVKGMSKATWMAKQMQNNFARLASAITAISIAIWQQALPAIEPYIGMMTNAAAVVVEWTDKYPHLTKYVGLAATAFIAFVAIAGLMNIAIGMARFAMVGFTMRFIVIKPVIWATRLAMLAYTATLWMMRSAVLAFVIYGPVLAAFFAAMKSSILTAVPAIWAFTAALLANPITWVVLGVVALIAAIAGLIIYWDEVTAAINGSWNMLKSLFENNAWMKVVFAPLYLGVAAVDAAIGAFEKIPQWWGSFKHWLSGITLMPSWNVGKNLTGKLSAKWLRFAGWIGALSLAPVWRLGHDFTASLSAKWSTFSGWMNRLILSPSWQVGRDFTASLSAKWSTFSNWVNALNLAPNWQLGRDFTAVLSTKWSEFSDWMSELILAPTWQLGRDFTAYLSTKWSAFSGWMSGLSLSPIWQLGPDFTDVLSNKWSTFSNWVNALNLAPNWQLGRDFTAVLSTKWSAFSDWISELSLTPTWQLGRDFTAYLSTKWSAFSDWMSELSLAPAWQLGRDFTADLSMEWSAFSNWIGGLSLAPEWKLGGDLVAGLVQKWGDFQVWFGSVLLVPSWDLHLSMFDSIKEWWTDFKGWLSALDPFAFLGEKVDWLKHKLSWLPGIDTTTNSTQEVISRVESQNESVHKSVVLPGAESNQSSSESGGLFQTISNMFGGSQKSLHVEKMEVNNHGQGVRGDDLLYQLEMEVG